ncbi:capsular biosynthesis protein [Lysinibacillus sp. FJAT-14745]|uniref:sugar transferase n=1 Tax=Lysinibacillus sp. FJAT-14745 TaxID=1704289 RepID=UPI0006ABC398|nr:sugar transferase [Lysinibacillus sp. FJAT-14745]KOP77796.1 capsular biosynthesis protein [Lysinibacillus sp. FJAT-14745]
MKRLLDIILSLIAIIILAVPMVFVSIAIKITSKGPILFTQKRVGKNGTHFEIYKFRSMFIETPDVSTEDLGDPTSYITPVGKFIRKTSIDELPQLLNIIKGDMSIVGPRPALYNQYELIEMRNNVNVNSVRPGLTGYAQVMGRDFISDKEKVDYDQYYVDNKSVMLDIKIIWMTFFSVLKTEGIKMK